MNIKVILSFAVIYVVWGSTFTAIKWGLDAFPPFILAGLRFSLAGVAFLIMSKGKGFRDMTSKDISREVTTGIFLTLGNAGVCWAEQYISSGVAALIVGAIPVMFILFNWFSFEKQTPHMSAVFGFLVGLVGIGLISTDSSSTSNWMVVLVLLLANCSWVMGSLKLRTARTNLPYFTRASVQLLSGSFFLFVSSSLMGERSVEWGNLPMGGILSVAYLALFGTILAYSCYTYLLVHVRTELTSTYALVNPLLAMIFGMLWLNEPFTVKVSLAASLILLSVVLVLYGPKLLTSLVRQRQ